MDICMCMYRCVQIYMCVYVYIYLCMHVYMYICIYVYMCICVYVSMYIYTHIYTDIYTQTDMLWLKTKWTAEIEKCTNTQPREGEGLPSRTKAENRKPKTNCMEMCRKVLTTKKT